VNRGTPAPAPAARPAARPAAGAGRHGGLDRPAVAYLVLSMLLGVSGQTLLKVAASALRRTPAGESLLAAGLASPALWAGLILYGSGTFCWLLALSRAPLGRLYPYTALNFVLILLPSAWLLHERIGATRLAGVTLIVAGIALHAVAERGGKQEAAP
jgi:drug/metabolite transporter (DMT)-like permease